MRDHSGGSKAFWTKFSIGKGGELPSEKYDTLDRPPSGLDASGDPTGGHGNQYPSAEVGTHEPVGRQGATHIEAPENPEGSNLGKEDHARGGPVPSNKLERRS